MPSKVRVPQESGEITISTGSESTTWNVNDHVVTAKNQAEADLIVGAVDGAEIDADVEHQTVDDVLAYATEHPDEIDAIRAAEVAGKNRSTLLARLDDLTP